MNTESLSGNPFSGLPFSVPGQYQGEILMASQRWGIPANVLAAQLEQESGFDKNAQSSAGAEGIAQFEPGTAAQFGLNPWDPFASIDDMAKLDAQYVRQFGSIDLALAAYNAGPGAVQSAGNQVPAIPQTQQYVNSILEKASLAGPTGSTGSFAGTDTGQSAPGDLSASTSLLGNIVDPEFWKRVGKGAAGAGIVGVGVYFLVSKQPGGFKPIKEIVNAK